MKSSQPNIEIEPSETNPNFYVIFRRNNLNSQEIAYAKVFPNCSYELEAIVSISDPETRYIRNFLLERADLTGKTLGFTIIE